MKDNSTSNLKRKKNINRNYNNINNYSYNTNDNLDSDSEGDGQASHYLDEEIEILGPKKKKTKNQDNSYDFKSQSFVNNLNNNRTAPKKNTYKNKISQKSKISKKNIYRRKTTSKVLAQKKKYKNLYNINQRSNSSDINKKINKNNNKFGGERLYEQYIKKIKIRKISNRILNEILDTDNKELIFKPQINENSKKIVENLRNKELEQEKVEEKLTINKNRKIQQQLNQNDEHDIRNKTKSLFRPKINPNFRNIANKLRKKRLKATTNIVKDKMKNIKYKKKIKSFEIEHKKSNYLNFDDDGKKNIINNIFKTNNIKYRNKNKILNIKNDNENNNNLNSYRNSTNDKNTLSDDKRETMSQITKTFELNKVFNDLYNSIDDQKEITKFFDNNSPKINMNLTDNFITRGKTKSNINKIKSKSLFSKERRSATPSGEISSYNTFDSLYYKSGIHGEKNKKKQELIFKRDHPFKPKLYANTNRLKINKKEETNKKYIKRITNIFKEIKINNSNDKAFLIKKSSEKEFRKKISRGQKSPNQKNINNKLKEYNVRKMAEKNKNIKAIKNDKEEKINLFNQKSKDIILKVKNKKYKELFDLLDWNQEGLISYSKIQFAKINPNVLNTISPILEELNQSKKKIDYNEFCMKADKLLTNFD